MSTEYTPTTDEVRATFAWQGVYTYGRQVEMQSEQFDRWLATARPNLDDAAQVDVVAQALYERALLRAKTGHGPWDRLAGALQRTGWDNLSDAERQPWRADARAVLTAQAAMGGER